MAIDYNYENGILAHKTLLNKVHGQVGIANIEVWARPTDSKDDKDKLNEENDMRILYLCGHIDGYDQSEVGFMIEKNSFLELINLLVYINPSILFKTVKLKNKNIKPLIKKLGKIKKNEILGDDTMKHEKLMGWIDQFNSLHEAFGNELKIFIRLKQ